MRKVPTLNEFRDAFNVVNGHIIHYHYTVLAINGETFYKFIENSLLPHLMLFNGYSPMVKLTLQDSIY